MKRTAFAVVLGIAGLLTLGLAKGEAPNADPFALENRDPRSPAPPAVQPNPMDKPPPAVNLEPAANPGEAWITINGQRVLVKVEDIQPVKDAARSGDKKQRVDFTAVIEPKVFAPGQVFHLKITGTPRPGYHTYPISQRANNEVQGEQQLSRITYENAEGLRPIWPITESQPRWHYDKDPKIGNYLVYDEEFTWTQDFLVEPNANPGDRSLKVTIAYQGCDASNCLQTSTQLEVPLKISGTPVPVSEAVQKRLETPKPEIKVLPQPSFTLIDPTNLWGLLLASMGAALAMLFTPCVFPMIPITVSFFLKQSEKKHYNAPLTAGVYSGTIIIVLALAVLLLGKLIVDWANSPWLNLGLAAVLLIFALSLFGMYDIELPSFLTRWTSSGEGRGGYLGAVFMALTFTITSFTCTGPFLGPLLIAAKEMQLDIFRLILASFAYSATFAAPFFVLALFPGLLKRLPKSGGWLNAVKVVMGFLEMAAALKFLANVDITLNPGNPWFFTYDTVLVSWIALSVACGIYLLGFIRLPHDTPQEHISVPRLVLATIFIGLGIYMTPALWRETPSGIIGQGLVAFLPLDTKPKKEEPYLDFEKAWEAAKRENKLIFIDFTGVNCTNCRANELNVFTRPAVREELKRYVVVQLYNDTVPNPDQSRAENYAQAQANAALQANSFGDASTPLYIILRPDGGEPIEDGKIQGTELARHAGYIHDRAKFLEMLRNPGKVAAE